MQIAFEKPWRSLCGLFPIVLASALAVGCRESSEPSVVEKREETQSEAVAPQPTPAKPLAGGAERASPESYSGPYGDPRPCAESPDAELCREGAPSFDVRCAGCHGMRGVEARKGPSLVGLVGRERVFLSGQSLIADEAYIRRSNYEIVGEDDVDEDQIRKEIEMRLESIDQCYETERARETEMPRGSRIGGQITLRLNGLRSPRDVVASGSIGNELVLACVVDAIADVVGSSPYLGLPSDAIGVVFKFVRTDADSDRPRWWLHQL